jgi:hypothetical protein
MRVFARTALTNHVPLGAAAVERQARRRSTALLLVVLPDAANTAALAAAGTADAGADDAGSPRANKREAALVSSMASSLCGRVIGGGVGVLCRSVLVWLLARA